MKTPLAAAIGSLLAFGVAHAAEHRDAPHDTRFGIALRHLSSIATDAGGSNGAEIVAYDTASKRAFAINSSDNELAVVDLSDPAAPILVDKVSFAAYGAGLNGVDTHRGLVAVAVEADPKTAPGKVVFIDARTLAIKGSVGVGALPDMLMFTEDGEQVLVANEGEPNSYLQPDSVNPEGSVSIISLERGIARASVRTVGFSGFTKEELLARGVRVFGPGATAAEDLEPEYITARGRTAWVTLQEANAVAVIDLPTASVREIFALGRKDHSVTGSGLDPSDRDGTGGAPSIRIGTWPVFGLYQPDAVATLRAGRDLFLVTSNEGDSRSSDDFPGFNEEIRVGSSGYVLDPAVYPDAAILKDNAALGRLTVTNASGDSDNDGDFDRIEAFGARSFSIWSAAGELVWDSGDQFEQYLGDPAHGFAALFNASNDTNALDNRSDNKGPEPEGVAIGRIGGRSFAFVGLERIGGVMAYDVTNPYAPSFAAYANTRKLDVLQGDLGPEGIEFVGEEASPNGWALVLVGNETSKTITIYQVDRTRK